MQRSGGTEITLFNYVSNFSIHRINIKFTYNDVHNRFNDFEVMFRNYSSFCFVYRFNSLIFIICYTFSPEYFDVFCVVVTEPIYMTG